MTTLEIPVLLEHPRLIAVHKPAGVTVVPARDEPAAASLRHRLEAARGEALWVVHRIDRDTSGVLLFARDAAAHRALSQAFERRTVRKRYLAWTRGAPAASSGVIRTPLHPARKGKMRPAREGEPGALESETRYELAYARETRAGVVCRVRAEPRTGRQHQVRVHLRSIAAPLLVDPLYGGCASLAAGALGAGSPEVPRLTLHASVVELDVFGEALHVAAPLPPDLAALEAWLVAQRAQDQS